MACESVDTQVLELLVTNGEHHQRHTGCVQSDLQV